MEEHCYIISYDIRVGNSYQALYDLLNKYEAQQITQSTWAVISSESCADLRDHLRTVINDDDRLFVILSGKSAAWNRTMADNQWLKTNLIK